jgi:hypothetical protein
MRASVDLFCMMAAVMKAGFTVAVTEDVIPEAIVIISPVPYHQYTVGYRQFTHQYHWRKNTQFTQ